MRQRLNGTPSIGEYERLEQAQQLAQNLDAFILLKGHYSALCLPNGNILFNSTGNSGMATAAPMEPSETYLVGTASVINTARATRAANGFTARPPPNPTAIPLPPWK